MKIGFFGGSFNPIHKGHIKLALSAKEEVNLDKVIFIPNNSNPIKENNTNVSAKERFNMVEIATKPYEYFEVDNFEIEKSGESFTIDTAKYLKEKYPEDELYFIGGADLMFQITKWKDYKWLLKNLSFIIANRSPYKVKGLANKVSELTKKDNANIYILKTFELIDISSSEILADIKGKMHKFVPKEVEDYIIKNNLYMEHLK